MMSVEVLYSLLLTFATAFQLKRILDIIERNFSIEENSVSPTIIIPPQHVTSINALAGD